MNIDVSAIRLKFQSLLLGLDTSQHGLLCASTFKAIKTSNHGGPKAKYLKIVSSAIREENLYPDEVIVWLGAINWKKDPVRAIRIIGFILHLLGPSTFAAFSEESADLALILLMNVMDYWGRPQAHVGFSHWDSPLVKAKLSNLVVYARNKVTLLRNRSDLPMFADNNEWNKSLSGQERAKILSLTLPSTGQLIDAITALDKPGPDTAAEQAAFRASIPLLLADLKHFFKVNSVLVVAVVRDEAVEELMREALKEEFLDLRKRLEGIEILVRGARETIFAEKDFPKL